VFPVRYELNLYIKLAVPGHALLWPIPDASADDDCLCMQPNPFPHQNLPFVFDGT
jgi:hypothetical protein